MSKVEDGGVIPPNYSSGQEVDKETSPITELAITSLQPLENKEVADKNRAVSIGSQTSTAEKVTTKATSQVVGKEIKPQTDLPKVKEQVNQAITTMQDIVSGGDLSSLVPNHQDLADVVDTQWDLMNSLEIIEKCKADPYLDAMRQHTMWTLRAVRIETNYGHHLAEPSLEALQDCRDFLICLTAEKSSGPIVNKYTPGEVQNKIKEAEKKQDELKKKLMADPMKMYKEFRSRLEGSEGLNAKFPEYGMECLDRKMATGTKWPITLAYSIEKFKNSLRSCKSCNANFVMFAFYS
jgi:hypothetical protein